MATLNAAALTYADWLARLDPKGATAVIINALSQTNEILQDMLVVEGNLPTGHKTTVRTGLPAAVWRQLNYGVPRAKSTTAQVVDTCGMLEVYSEMDKDLAALNGHAPAFLFSEDLASLEGMNQQNAFSVWRRAIRRSIPPPPRRPPTSSTWAVPVPPTPPSGSWCGESTPCMASSPRAACAAAIWVKRP